jgi:hypothetical protein
MVSKKTRRRWLEGEDDSLGGGDDFIPVGRQDQVANTGHIVRMRRGEAWSKFLAYEGCCQVWLRGVCVEGSAVLCCAVLCCAVLCCAVLGLAAAWCDA